MTDTCERMMVAGYLRMPFHPFPRSEYGAKCFITVQRVGFQRMDSGSGRFKWFPECSARFREFRRMSAKCCELVGRKQDMN